MSETIKFTDLGLSAETLAVLDKSGFVEPTTIQEKCIPLALQGQVDIVGQAATGTGKTAAFGLPILEMVDPNLNHTQALILAPTRELAVQIVQALNNFKGARKLKIAAIYGGASIGLQLNQLRAGVHIVVGTPGRVIDMIGRKKLLLEKLSFLVLDEADEMLNMGFVDDVEDILSHTPPEKRMMLFSATLSPRILTLAKKYMPNYQFVEVKKTVSSTSLTEQMYYEVGEADKFETLRRVIDINPDFYGLIFCKTKAEVDTITNRLKILNYKVEGIHGDIAQAQREKVFAKFKAKQVNILVATDVAARGIDVNDLTHVINYAIPRDPESYTHRVGRTGRAGKKGIAINIITPSEFRKLSFIMRATNANVRKEKLPEIADVIRIKKERLLGALKKLIDNGEHATFKSLAKEIVDEYDPEQIIAALLKHSFQNELDVSKYREIRQNNLEHRTGGNNSNYNSQPRKNFYKKPFVKFNGNRNFPKRPNFTQQRAAVAK